MFASAITEEKEVDSLGLLMMTGINPLSMLLSKGTGKLVMGLMLIVSQFPFVLLAITMGGVSLYQILSVFITLLVYMILINNLALFCSVFFSRSATAATVCFFALAAFNILTPIWQTTQWLSPFYRMTMIMKTFSTEPVWGMQNTIYIIVSVLFFLLSYIIFDACCRNTKPSSAPRLPANSRKAKWNIFRVRRTWQNAIAWKTFYFNVGGKYSIFIIHSLLFMMIAIMIILGIIYDDFMSIDAEALGGIILTTGLIALFVEGIYISDAIFHSEVWNQTLSTLLTIPESLKSIAYKKILGGLIITIPTLLFIAVGLLLVMDDLIREIDDPEFWGVLLIFILSVVFYYHLVAFFSLIMKYGGFIIAWFAFGVIYTIVTIPIAIISNLFGYWIGSWINGGIIIVLVILLYIPCIFFLHILIGKKIKSIAAKG